ncbi:MAG: globin [Chakrabartia sp.]
MSNDDLLSLMEAPLIAIADADIDITPALFDRFFERFPEQRAGFFNLQAAAGRMTNETVAAMIGLASDESWVPVTITNFVDLHRNYGVFPASLYAAFVDMTVDIIAESAGKSWTKESEKAWRTQAERLNTLIGSAIRP